MSSFGIIPVCRSKLTLVYATASDVSDTLPNTARIYGAASQRAILSIPSRGPELGAFALHLLWIFIVIYESTLRSSYSEHHFAYGLEPRATTAGTSSRTAVSIARTSRQSGTTD